jgi:hypothetical protein
MVAYSSRPCSRISDDQESGDEVDGGAEGFGQLVVACGDAAELFELIEEALDAVAPPIEALVVGEFLAAGAEGRNNRLETIEGEALPDAIGVVTSVEGGGLQDIVRVEAFVEAFKLPPIMGLAGSQVQGYRAVLVDGGRVDLRAEAPARAAQSLVGAVFFGAPAAC